MIKFEPHIIEVRRPLSFYDSGSILHNESNKELAAQLEEQYKETSCPDHPGFENKMVVNVADKDNVLKVASSCCPDFRQELHEIARSHKIANRPANNIYVETQRPPDRFLVKMVSWIAGVVLGLWFLYEFMKQH